MKRQRSSEELKWLYRYSRKYLWLVFLLSVISMMISLSFILIAMISKQILDIATGNLDGSIINYSIFLLLVILFQAICNIISSNCRVRSQAKIENNIKQQMLQSLMNKTYPDIVKNHSGELMNRFTSDVGIVSAGLVGFIPQIFSLFTKIIAGIAVLFTMNVSFTLVILSIGLITVICSRLYSRKFRYLHKELQRTNGVVRSFMQECIENVIVVKSFVNENSIQNQLDKQQQENYRIRVKQNTISNIASTSIYVMMASGYYVALGWGAIQISKGLLTFGTLTAFLQILDQIKAPFRNVSGLIPRYDSMIASAQRLIEIEMFEDEKKDTRISDVDCFYQSMNSINFSHCNFAYKEKLVLKDVDLVISKGDVIAITGESGNGKTTLFHLMLGLFNVTRGEIYFNGQFGKVKLDAGTRNLFSYVPQGNMILSGTIRENIMFANPSASEQRLEEVINVSCLRELIDSLPEGIDTRLGERGIGLSQGQNQRISIARALISEAPILLLDECTSSLDIDTEKKLLLNLKTYHQKTVLCISHRNAAIECCDRIIKVQDGYANYSK